MKRPILVVSAAALALAAGFVAPVRADDIPAEKPAAAMEAKGVVFEEGTPAFADVLAKAKAAGKPVFIDFSTEWCGWCKKLDKDTYTQASVGDAMKGFVNARVDAEKGEGIELKTRYAVSGYPTLLIVDAAGEEIDRIVGYRPPEAFLREIGRIQSGEGTIPTLRAKFAAAPDDVDAGSALGAKLALSKPAEASAIFSGLIEKSAGKDHETQGKLRLEYAVALLGAKQPEEAMAQAEALVTKLADSAAAGTAASRVGGAFLRAPAARALAFFDAARAAAKEPADKAMVERLTMAVHRNGIAAALKRQGEAAGDDPQALNEAAWSCFEQKVNVKDAIGWAQKAVEKSGRDAAILDTLANLLWLSGKHDEAVKLEEEAAGKAKGAMKRELQGNLAKWKAETAPAKEGETDEDGEEEDDE